MDVDPSGEVSGVGPQAQVPETKAVSQAQQQVSLKVFTVLMEILGSFSEGIMNQFLPRLAKLQKWEGAASGVYYLFSINPGTAADDYKNGQLTPKELSIFGNGWEWLRWAYQHQGSKEWKSMPPNMREWATAVMSNPTISGKLNGIYAATAKLQKLQSEHKPWKEQYHKVLAQVVDFQKLGTGKDTKMVNEFNSLKNLSRTTTSAMAALSTLTYSMADGVVLKISSLTKYASQLIQHLETVKAAIARGIQS